MRHDVRPSVERLEARLCPRGGFAPSHGPAVPPAPAAHHAGGLLAALRARLHPPPPPAPALTVNDIAAAVNTATLAQPRTALDLQNSAGTRVICLQGQHVTDDPRYASLAGVPIPGDPYGRTWDQEPAINDGVNVAYCPAAFTAYATPAEAVNTVQHCLGHTTDSLLGPPGDHPSQRADWLALCAAYRWNTAFEQASLVEQWATSYREYSLGQRDLLPAEVWGYFAATVPR